MAEYLGSITLASVEDGESGEGYIIESNHDFIYRAQTTPSTEGDITKIFSPDSIVFKVYTHNVASPLVPGTDYYYSFYYLGPEFQDAHLPISLDNVSEVDSQTNSVLFHMANLRTQSETSPMVGTIYQICLSGDGFFAFNVYEDTLKTTLLNRYVFYVQNALSASLSSFEVTATKIQGLVDQSALFFTGDGITLYNGGLTIYNVPYDPESPPALNKRVFYFDPNGGLYITGNSTFTGTVHATDGDFYGTVYATDGSFSGEILAQSGTIGGFSINNTSLTSTDFQYVQYDPQPSTRTEGESYYIYDSENDEYILYTGSIPPEGEETLIFYERKDLHSIILNGSDGSIYANNIILGEFATIDDYIKIGSGDYTSYICNPNKAVGREYNEEGIPYGLPYFFKVNNNVYLTATGEFGVGRIILDGANSTIKGTGVEQDPNFGWPDFYITPEKAYFRNVDISGKISTTVFEVGHTQAVGGSMLFKPSFKIQTYDKHEENGEIVTTLYFDEDLSAYLNPYTAVENITEFTHYYVAHISYFDPLVDYFIYDDINDEYLRIRDTEPFDSNLTYYIYVDYYELDNNEYVSTEDDSPVRDKQYFISNVKYITVLGEDGNLVQIQDGEQEKVFVGSADSYEFDTDTNLFKLTINRELTGVLSSLIVLGQDDDLIIGVNAYNQTSAFLRPRGITIAEFNHQQSFITIPEPKVYIGDLSKAGFAITGLEVDRYSYGLYSNNVILNGSLTTQVDSNTEVNRTYAGVNTLSRVNANKFTGVDFPEQDDSKIVFWAGSHGVQSTQIQESPFQVTERGSIYAQNGLFEGVIIARSKIKGVDIYAARIHGAAQDPELMGQGTTSQYGLAFYDAAQGIVFKAGGDSDNDPNIHTVFTIGSNGLYTETTNFINITNTTVDFNGDDFSGNNFTAANLIKGLQLQSLKGNTSITIGGNSTTDQIVYNGAKTSYIDFYNSNGEISFSNGNSVEQFTLNINSANFNVEELHSTENFQLGATPGQGYMRYQKVTNGYDLFI